MVEDLKGEEEEDEHIKVLREDEPILVKFLSEK